MTRRPSDPALHRLLARRRYELVPLPGALDRARSLPPGTTVTVTCSPSRGLEPTVALAEALAGAGYHAVPHLAARSVGGEVELKDAVERLVAAGVADVFVVGGDRPDPSRRPRPGSSLRPRPGFSLRPRPGSSLRPRPGPYASGSELLAALAQLGAPFADIGVPAYPEGHPTIETATLWQALLDKQPQATYVVTQMCFDPSAIAAWCRHGRAVGLTLPVFAGMPGVVGVGQLARMSAAIGVGDSSRFLRSHGRLVRQLLRPRGYRPDRLLRQLARETDRLEVGLRGVHVYTFNQVAASAARLQALRGA